MVAGRVSDPVVVVDYGMGNVGSVCNMLKKVGGGAVVSGSRDVIGRAGKLVLPGVGAFDTAMQNIGERHLLDVLNERVLGEGVPILGICLGMQLLTERSEEGTSAGLGWIAGRARRFPDEVDGRKLVVPHMGWNHVSVGRPSALTQGLEADARFYFVHSFYVTVEDQAHSVLTTTYGVSFDSAIGSRNVMGVQFHPEKSHRYGMALLRNFVAM